MKTKFLVPAIALILCRSLLAGDSADLSRASTLPQEEKPAACCAADAKPKAACCADGDKAACCVEKSAAPAACCAEKAKPAACCAQVEKPTPAACCPVEEPVAKKPDACCAEIENPESKIQNFSSESLYQLEVGFTDDSGRPFTLGSLRGRPVVLTMFFASCGYACPLLLTDMQAIRAKLPVEIRDQAALVLVSFDVARDTPAALAQYRTERQLDAQWTLLHGDDDAVRELAALLGVKYKQEADGQFAHSNLITILNAGGEVVHQRNGLRGGLDETAQAIVAAAR
jgi:protein SCO1/2